MTTAQSLVQLLHRILLATEIGFVVIAVVMVGFLLAYVWHSEAAAHRGGRR